MRSRGVLAGLLCAACSVGCDLPGKTLQVQYPDGAPVASAAVSVGHSSVGLTDDDGEISIGASGKKVVTIHKSENGCSFSHAEEELDLDSTSEFVLPRPVSFVRAPKTTPTEVHLSWAQADEVAFREYRVYASWNAEFDEKTGTLLHVELDRANTALLVDGRMTLGGPLVRPGRRVYFRVFVLTTDSTLAGSCTLGVTPPLWDASAFTVRYRLVEERNFAGTAHIGGIAYDGSKLWLLYRAQVGDYYDPDDLSLVRIDPLTAAVERTFSFNDYADVAGLTWDGEALWLSFHFDHPGLSRFDPVTDTLTFKWAMEYGTVDLAWDGQHLLASKTGPEIQRIDRATGGIVGKIPSPLATHDGNVNAGIAYRPGELWLGNRQNTDVAIVNDAGVHIGIASGLPTTMPESLFLTFMGDKLVSASGPRVTVYRIE